MNKNIVYGLIVIIAIAFVVIDSFLYPPPPFEMVEYPITVFVNMAGRHCQITLYDNGTGFFETPYGSYYGQWEIQEKDISSITYLFEYTDNRGVRDLEQFILYPAHRGTWEPGPWGGNFRAHWDYTEYTEYTGYVNQTLLWNYSGVEIWVNRTGTRILPQGKAIRVYTAIGKAEDVKAKLKKGL